MEISISKHQPGYRVQLQDPAPSDQLARDGGDASNPVPLRDCVWHFNSEVKKVESSCPSRINEMMKINRQDHIPIYYVIAILPIVGRSIGSIDSHSKLSALARCHHSISPCHPFFFRISQVSFAFLCFPFFAFLPPPFLHRFTSHYPCKVTFLLSCYYMSPSLRPGWSALRDLS
jgi:hypothetical protein